MSLQITATLTCDGCGAELHNEQARDDMRNAFRALGLDWAKLNLKRWVAVNDDGLPLKHLCPKCKSNRIDSEPCCAKV